MFYIPNIGIDALLHFPEFISVSTIAADLSPPGNSGFYHVAKHIFINQLAILLGVNQHVGPRTDDGHITHPDIDKLRKFVKRSASQKVTHLGFARVSVCGLHLVAVGIDSHSPELQTHEVAATITRALLFEEHRAGLRKFNGNGDRNKN